MSAFDKVIGYENEKKELFQLCDMAKNPEKYKKLGVRLPRGVLLVGVPGIGKTLMAGALVEEIGRKSFLVRKDRPGQELVTEISNVFAEAMEAAPSVIFLDDMDKFPADSDKRNPDELIAVQSGIDLVKDADVFVVATANDIRYIPPSLRRPGRFDRIIAMGVPSLKESVEIIRHYLADKKIADDVDPESVARMMDGKSCAELESVLNEAGIYAGFDGRELIGREHIIRAVLHVIFGTEESLGCTNEAEKEVIAFHEAGHAAAAFGFSPGSVGLVSVRATSRSSRGVMQQLRGEKGIKTYAQLRAQVVIDLAGKAAVEMKFGVTDVGAMRDLGSAARSVQDFIIDGATAGFELLHTAEPWAISGNGQYERVSEERGAELARCFNEAKALLMRNWGFVECLAAELVKKDTLVYEEINELYDKFVKSEEGK